MSDEVDNWWTGQQLTMTTDLTYLSAIADLTPQSWTTERFKITRTDLMYYQAQWGFGGEVYIDGNDRLVVADIRLQFYQLFDMTDVVVEVDFWGAFAAPVGRIHETQELVLDPDWWMDNVVAQQIQEEPRTTEEPFRDGNLCGWGMAMKLLITGD